MLSQRHISVNLNYTIKLIKMHRQISTKNPDSQNVYIGLDVHLKQWNVCIIQGGVRRKPFQQSPSAAALASYLEKHFPSMRYFSAYEAGVCGCSVHYELENAGIRNIIFNAADIAQTHKEKVRKTDSVDASKIARSLCNGELRCIHIPPQWRIEDRNLLRLRGCRISDIKRNKARLRHFLHTNGIRIPQDFTTNKWTKAFIEWVRSTAAGLDNCTGESLMMMLENVVRQMSELAALDRRLIELMRTHRYKEDYELVKTVPGVGAVTATTILLECGDLADFKSAEAFCAFIGLVPDCHDSGDHTGQCGITKRRHKVMRYMLTECAWRSLHKDQYLSDLYASYTRRMPSEKAIIKIANKLAKFIKFVLKNKKAYVPKKSS